jgi:histidyl-tRNA synthetase
MKDISTKALSGFMELSPAHQLEFERLKNIITQTYATYGFTPLDTPTLERSEVLAAKVGAETQKQIYRFERGGHDLSLRFDLTVPLSRYVVEHRNDLVFPFRRQQISKVFRGERAQKGRYREFYQCDADIIGAGSLDIAYDSEIIALINETFTRLNLAKFQIRINNRKLVTGFLDALGVPDKTEIIALIDKSEKISPADLAKELDLLRLNALEKRVIIKFIATKGDFATVKTFFDNLSAPTNDDITQGLSDLEQINAALTAMDIPPENYIFNLAIVRGLDYYTGTIFETQFIDYASLGSVCGGGRYDNLASVFSNQKMPGVGMSIGLTRLFSQLQEIGLINSVAKTVSQVVVLPLTDNLPAVFQTVAALRAGNVKVELYLETAKLDKKMKYAANLGVPYVILLGDDEVKNNRLTVKNMHTGEQENLSLAQAVDLLAN